MSTLKRELRLKFREVFKYEPLFGSLWTNEPQRIIESMLDRLTDKLADAALEVSGLSRKEPLQNASLDWAIAANLTSEEVAGFAAREQREKDTAILYEKEMGYSVLPFWTDKGLGRLLKFLLTKSPEEIKTFAEWSKRPYAGLNPVKARQYPNLVIECWDQAFDIGKRGSEPREHAL